MNPLFIHRVIMFLAIILLGVPATVLAVQPKTGFLVVAPDRGFLGNQEIRTLFDEFKTSYSPAALVLIGRDYNGIGTEYSTYVSLALNELKQTGVREIIAIPLFLSKADPVLQKTVTHLPSYGFAGMIRWTAPMVDSYLISQILLDRVDAISRDPDQERLLLLGAGATDETNEAAMKADLERLLSYLTRYKRFKEARTVLYYDRAAPGAEQKNKAADRVVIETAAKKGRTLLALAAIGPKFDQSMALTTWLKEKFSELDVMYTGEELFPHANLLLWLKKTANAYLPASQAEIGVVIMPHGATLPWNDAVERVIEPLKSRFRVEMAYGMGDPSIMQQAISRLEQQGIRRIIFVRMYALRHHLRERIEYMLGLSETPPTTQHDDHGREEPPPPQIRSSALFATFGGYEEDPRIAQVLHERIMEVSQDPSRETAILVSHGEKSDEGNAKWLAVMQANIEQLKKDPHCVKLRAIHATTVREDWPEKREQAVAEARRMIQEGARTGRVLVIADRLYGSGPYKQFFNGLDYVLNEKGLAHPVLTGWLEEGIGRMMGALAAPLERADRSTQEALSAAKPEAN